MIAHLDLTRPGRDNLLNALLAMNETAPVDWWRYVPCETCNAQPEAGCVQGYDGWPNPARSPHVARRRAGSVLWATLYRLTREQR